jgi:hypothetical protein
MARPNIWMMVSHQFGFPVTKSIDDVKLGELGLQGSEFIGLDYSGRSSRNTGRFIERAIKIFN